jgi:hypothetical protein
MPRHYNLTNVFQASISKLSTLAAQDDGKVAVSPSADSHGQIDFGKVTWPDEGRPRKRLRLSSAEYTSEPLDKAQQLRRQLNLVLFAEETVEIRGMRRTAL